MNSLWIDVGHTGVGAGFDPGAVNKAAGLYEAEYTLKISLYQYYRLKGLGINVGISRMDNKIMSNTERTNLVKKSGAKHCISNHINAGGGDGAELIHSLHADKKFSELCKQAFLSVGQNVRRIFSRSLPNNPKVDYYYMHRNTGAVQTTIIEYGFLDSKGDDIIQIKQDWEKMAEAIVKAYCTFINHPYTAPLKQVEQVKEEVNEIVSQLPPIEYIDEFQDVPKDHALAKEIIRAKELGLMNGTGEGYFAPDVPLTRAQGAAIIVRLYDALNKK